MLSGLSVADAGAVSFTVPFRSFAPIVDIDDPDIFLGGGPTETNVLTLQYTGFQATGELRTFRRWNRARNVAEFREGLDEFDVRPTKVYNRGFYREKISPRVAQQLREHYQPHDALPIAGGRGRRVPHGRQILG